MANDLDGQIAQQLQLSKCVTPACEGKVRVKGEFCASCRDVQRRMREQLQAQRRIA